MVLKLLQDHAHIRSAKARQYCRLQHCLNCCDPLACSTPDGMPLSRVKVSPLLACEPSSGMRRVGRAMSPAFEFKSAIDLTQGLAPSDTAQPSPEEVVSKGRQLTEEVPGAPYTLQTQPSQVQAVGRHPGHPNLHAWACIPPLQLTGDSNHVACHCCGVKRRVAVYTLGRFSLGIDLTAHRKVSQERSWWNPLVTTTTDLHLHFARTSFTEVQTKECARCSSQRVTLHPPVLADDGDAEQCILPRRPGLVLKQPPAHQVMSPLPQRLLAATPVPEAGHAAACSHACLAQGCDCCTAQRSPASLPPHSCSSARRLHLPVL